MIYRGAASGVAKGSSSIVLMLSRYMMLDLCSGKVVGRQVVARIKADDGDDEG